MVTKKYWIAGTILVAAVAAFMLFFVDWEARAVKKQLRSLAGEMAWSPAENQITAVTRIKAVQDKISETCQVYLPSYRISQIISRNDVPTYLTIAKNYYKDLSIKFEDLKVESIQLPQARAITTARVRATGIDGLKNDEALVIGFELRKIDKKWQIVSVEEKQVVER